MLLEISDWRNAAKAWRRIVLVTPNRPSDLVSLTVAMSRTDDIQSCLTVFYWAAKLKPTDIRTQFSWATVLFNSGKFREAEEKMRVVLESGIQDPKVHFWMGRILHARSRKTEAGKHLDIAAQSGAELMHAASMIRKTVVASDYAEHG
ncbi:MAG: hypothetical protein P8N43_15730 [Alphaproteobacteria bacterium]|nr:hypothetical protein [Alphaproteobacteria bacterium]